MSELDTSPDILLCLKIYEEEPTLLVVRPTMLVEELQEKIRKMSKSPPERQQLHFGSLEGITPEKNSSGPQLLPGHELSEYGIGHRSPIVVTPPPEQFPIIVRGLDGARLPLIVDQEDMVISLKRRIHEELGFSVHKQRLLHKDQSSSLKYTGREYPERSAYNELLQLCQGLGGGHQLRLPLHWTDRRGGRRASSRE